MNEEEKKNIEWWIMLVFRVLIALLGLFLFVYDKVLRLLETQLSDLYYLAFLGIAIFGDKIADAYAKIKGGNTYTQYPQEDKEDE